MTFHTFEQYSIIQNFLFYMQILERHGAEICKMSLDVLDQIRILEIPHLPGTRFQLRIGIHSGPVAAGK